MGMSWGNLLGGCLSRELVISGMGLHISEISDLSYIQSKFTNIDSLSVAKGMQETLATWIKDQNGPLQRPQLFFGWGFFFSAT